MIWEGFVCLERKLRQFHRRGGGTECTGCPMQIQKSENVDNLPKNGPIISECLTEI